tara:strand:- start:59 stop:379 length:321 start_codon:yes stop_codon:yes gene_type:complete
MSVLRYNRFYYDPLPNNVKIAESNIHGHGIFAKENIKSKTDLGSTHIKYPMIVGYVRTPMGGFINHSDDPNCYLIVSQDWDDFIIYNVVTAKKILKDEELFLNYEV